MVDTILNISASSKQFRQNTKPTECTQHLISSLSTLSNSKYSQEQFRPRNKPSKNGLQLNKSPRQLSARQPRKPKPVSTLKRNSKEFGRTKNDSPTAIRSGKHFHGTYHQRTSLDGAEEQRSRMESRRFECSPKLHRRKSSASVGNETSGSQKYKIKSNHLGTGGNSKKKLTYSPKSSTFQPTYVCEKHQHLSRTITKSTSNPSAADSRISELTNNTRQASSTHSTCETGKATSQPKATYNFHSIPLVLARKPKSGDDSKRISADAIHCASIHKNGYLQLGKQASIILSTKKNPNNCNIKVIKFHNVEIIEQHDPEMEQDGKVMLKIIHKSRQLQQPQKRLNLISEEDTELTRMMLEYMLDAWTTVVKIWKVEGYLQRDEPYETVEFDARQHQTLVVASQSNSNSIRSNSSHSNSNSSGRNSSSSLGSVNRLRQSSLETIRPDESLDQSEQMRTMARQYLAKKRPTYQETITTQLRYNYRRKKRFYPIHMMEHVLKYKRPPFWNYSRKYGGFNVLLNKHQLENLYELVRKRVV